MKIFISGGCKNGKSYYAQHLAKALQTGVLYYVATMRSVDSEDDERILRHRRERDGWGFITVEQPVDVGEILSKCDRNGSILLDSVTALLANEMFLPDGSVNENAADKIIREFWEILKNIENIVIVSDYIYSDAFLYDATTEKYRKSLAEIDRALAKFCDVALEVAYTNITARKGSEAFDLIREKIF